MRRCLDFHRVRRVAFTALLAGAALSAYPVTARAQASETEADDEEPNIRGVESEARHPGDGARLFANVLLFLPRESLELLLTATGAAAGLIEDEQVVPRVRGLLRPQPGEISIFPTVFAETGEGFNVGGRAIARQRNFASSLRGGIGSKDELVGEARVRTGGTEPFPFVVNAETFIDRGTSTFVGIGQRPRQDPRNVYNPLSEETTARFIGTRERFLLSIGGRFLSDMELFLSSSVRWRKAEPPNEAGRAIGEVFVPGTVPGAREVTQYVYTEATGRLDTRPSRGGLYSGVLLELYSGLSGGFSGTEGVFARGGGRAAAFIPIVRRTNILSPKLVVDGLERLSDDPVPFTELVRQPDFRGFDNRRDNLSVVASLDYRWAIWRYIATRIFVDSATVAPSVSALTLDELRFAYGFGFDLFSRSAPLGALNFIFSPEGFRFAFRFGVASSFGDRQHR